jgi:2-polyprenyl-6-methoxyphenol hydroxylase-like FAD-dependent oxidoreductase
MALVKVMNTIETTCCVVGGGPAGIMAGYLLARGGISVTVLEKHRDFLRDFRGDTIHPSTMLALKDLGLLDAFLALPHQEVARFRAFFDDRSVPIADFTHLPKPCRFIAFMPQWDFLNFMAEKGRVYPTFSLHMETEATELVVEAGEIKGVLAKSPDGELQIRSRVVIAADGRRSTLRAQAGFEVLDLQAAIDVLWLRLPREANDPDEVLGRFLSGNVLVMINRGEYWQCGYVIAKGEGSAIQARGLDNFRAQLLKSAPFLGERVRSLQSWDDVKLLTVAVDRLKTWHRPGLLCIGDSAHAMSPVGGVGINLAIQDAIAAANVLGPQLLANSNAPLELVAVQHRREWPTRVLQRLQKMIQDRVIKRALGGQALQMPFFFRLLIWFPVLRRIPASLMGLGPRRECVVFGR